MLRFFLVLITLAAGLTVAQAQVTVQLTNNSADTWTVNFVDAAGTTSGPQVIAPGGNLTATYPVIVYPVFWSADNGLGCGRTGVINAPPANRTYPVNCSPNTATVTVTAINLIPSPASLITIVAN